MRWFTGRSMRDREHLIQTLRSLGPTSVAGLSAALSWPERRTERVLEDAARNDPTLRYDVARRTVALSAPGPAPAVAAPSVPAPSAPAPTPPPALPKSWGASAKCPACQVAYLPTGTGAQLYCPQCGRLAGLRSPVSRPADPPESAARSGATPGPVGAPTIGSDRRSQEMFAAWVTAQPIPCPKCRTPLRHHGVAEYACPACGARVAFERSAHTPPSRSAPSPPSGAPAPTTAAPPAR